MRVAPCVEALTALVRLVGGVLAILCLLPADLGNEFVEGADFPAGKRLNTDAYPGIGQRDRLIEFHVPAVYEGSYHGVRCHESFLIPGSNDYMDTPSTARYVAPHPPRPAIIGLNAASAR